MNKIHVVIGEQDEQFLVHLVNIMENGFKEYIEAHCFSKPEFYLKYVRNNGGDVFLVDENFGVGAGELGQENCGYLCDSNDEPVLKGYKTVGKYQRPDAIYAQIMDIYANGGLAPVPETEPEPELFRRHRGFHLRSGGFHVQRFPGNAHILPEPGRFRKF